MDTRLATQSVQASDCIYDLKALYQGFEDKIFLGFSESGKYAQFISVKLERDEPGGVNDQPPGLLPMTHLTSKFLLGSSDSLRSDMAGLLAVQIGSLILSINPQETRELIVAVTLPGTQKFWIEENAGHTTVFHALIELATSILSPPKDNTASTLHRRAG